MSSTNTVYNLSNLCINCCHWRTTYNIIYQSAGYLFKTYTFMFAFFFFTHWHTLMLYITVWQPFQWEMNKIVVSRWVIMCSLCPTVWSIVKCHIEEGRQWLAVNGVFVIILNTFRRLYYWEKQSTNKAKLPLCMCFYICHVLLYTKTVMVYQTFFNCSLQKEKVLCLCACFSIC